jgi:hypothetical protein
MYVYLHGRIWGVQGVRTPLPAESALFPAESALFPAESALFCRIFPRKGTRSFIAQNQKFSPEKKYAFLATSKDVESYSQMPGKRILALEFSNFSGGVSAIFAVVLSFITA